MIEFDFMKRDKLHIGVVKENIKKHYGIDIDGKSLLDDLYISECMNQIFSKVSIERICVDDVKDIMDIEDDDMDVELKGAIKTFEMLIPYINELIYDLANYRDDLFADIYMGLLRADSMWDIEFYLEMENEWKKQAQNSHIDVECARKHYPFATERDFPNDSIPGGCEAYHRLMIQQKNIGIFDVSMKAESLQRYAYPKTNEIYQELKTESVENLLLLEATLGIDYTNLVFGYTKKIINAQELERLKGIIEQGLKVEPIFLRKKVVDCVWKYIKKMKYSEYGMEVAGKMLFAISYEINKIYRFLLRFLWSVYYLAYKEDKKNVDLYFMRSELRQCWQKHFDDADVYSDWIGNENIHDWRGMETVEDCFAYIRKGECLSLGDWECFTVVQIEPLIGEMIEFYARKPLNGVGEEVRKRAIAEMSELFSLPQTDDEKRELLYQIEEKVFDELKKEDLGAWYGKDPKASTNHLKPLHVYAMVHAHVVRCLN